MKIFIVFFAMLIVNISFLSFNSDMDRYVKLQIHLKAVAEESAAGAALFHDRDAYGQGVLSIDETVADAYIQFIAQKSKENDPLFSVGDIIVETHYFDDVKGYSCCSQYKVDKENPAVVVTLTYSGEDLFRLPFLFADTVSRTATYQWDDGLTSPF